MLARLKPFDSSHNAKSSILTLLPGAAEKAADAMNLSGGARWVSALTVPTRMRGRSTAPRVRASRASTAIRSADTAAFGETRS